jgi:hypothetical protein
LVVRRLGLLVATFWVGSLWAIGYVVAPTLFATLADRVLAGTIAGSLFRVEAWLSLVCGVILTLLVTRVSVTEQAPATRKRILQLIAAMMLCTLVGYFGLQPFMAAIRESSAAAGGMSGDAKLHFGILHGAASAIYLLQSLAGGWLICKLT